MLGIGKWNIFVIRFNVSMESYKNVLWSTSDEGIINARFLR